MANNQLLTLESLAAAFADFQDQITTRLLGSQSVTQPGINPIGGVAPTSNVPRPQCRVAISANQSIGNASYQVVTWDTTIFDPLAMHSTTSNTSRIVAPVAGWYSVKANLAFDTGVNGAFRGGKIRKNGTTETGIACLYFPPQGASGFNVPVIGDLFLNALDFIELMAYQDNGAGLNLLFSGAPGFTWLSLTQQL